MIQLLPTSYNQNDSHLNYEVLKNIYFAVKATNLMNGMTSATGSRNCRIRSLS